jgi:carboxymethylenebutenolidase
MPDTTSEVIGLRAPDGHCLDAFLARPAGTPRGGIVVVQEIFGVTSHIKAVASQYAAAGYLAVAPALFDRIGKGIEIPYTDVPAGLATKQRLLFDQTMLDLGAAVSMVGVAGKVGMVGYCWGGSMAYAAACRLPLAAGVSYYGGGLPLLLDQTPKCPVAFHFGERDTHIPATDIAKVRSAYPDGVYYLYAADHGFNCTDRPSYDPPSARLALERSLEFFGRHVG